MRIAHVLARTTFSTMLALGSVAVVATGCTNQTEGERTAKQAGDLKDAADMIRRGEQMERDGASMVARGEELKRQGDNSAGDKMIAEGKSKGKAGEELVQQGRMLRDKAKM